MIENVLPAALAAYILEIPVENIKNALYSFHPNEEQMPGRMNITSIARLKIIVDYSLYPHGFKAFSGFIKNLKEEKTGIITGVGDRRKEDIIEVGQLAAEMYDRIINRVDKDTRGRKPEEIIALVREGVHQQKPELSCEVVPETKAALKHALDHSNEDSYIVVHVDSVPEALEIVKHLKEEYEHHS
jgi:cyanophycin synthetase